MSKCTGCWKVYYFWENFMISCSLVKENGTVNCSFELSNVNSFLEVNKINKIDLKSISGSNILV